MGGLGGAQAFVAVQLEQRGDLVLVEGQLGLADREQLAARLEYGDAGEARPLPAGEQHVQQRRRLVDQPLDQRADVGQLVRRVEVVEYENRLVVELPRQVVDQRVERPKPRMGTLAVPVKQAYRALARARRDLAAGVGQVQQEHQRVGHALAQAVPRDGPAAARGERG